MSTALGVSYIGFFAGRTGKAQDGTGKRGRMKTGLFINEEIDNDEKNRRIGSGVRGREWALFERWRGKTELYQRTNTESLINIVKKLAGKREIILLTGSFYQTF